MYNILHVIKDNKLYLEVDLTHEGPEFTKSIQVADVEQPRGIRIPDTDFYLKLQVYKFKAPVKAKTKAELSDQVDQLQAQLKAILDAQATNQVAEG